MTTNTDAVPSELHEAARVFHNLTIGDSTVIIRPWTAAKRDAIVAAGERLRAALTSPTVATQADHIAGEGKMVAAWRDVLAERQRQVSVKGWTPEHDDEHANGDMALAAACYAASAGGVPWSDDVPSFWPWADQWWKPTTPRRDLVKAGALILAEIERIDRAASSTGDQA